MELSEAGLPRAQVEAMTKRETDRYIQSNPTSQKLGVDARANWIKGVPHHWMLDWLPYRMQNTWNMPPIRSVFWSALMLEIITACTVNMLLVEKHMGASFYCVSNSIRSVKSCAVY